MAVPRRARRAAEPERSVSATAAPLTASAVAAEPAAAAEVAAAGDAEPAAAEGDAATATASPTDAPETGPTAPTAGEPTPAAVSAAPVRRLIGPKIAPENDPGQASSAAAGAKRRRGRGSSSREGPDVRASAPLVARHGAQGRGLTLWVLCRVFHRRLAAQDGRRVGRDGDGASKSRRARRRRHVANERPAVGGRGRRIGRRFDGWVSSAGRVYPASHRHAGGAAAQKARGSPGAGSHLRTPVLVGIGKVHQPRVGQVLRRQVLPGGWTGARVCGWDELEGRATRRIPRAGAVVSSTARRHHGQGRRRVSISPVL